MRIYQEKKNRQKRHVRSITVYFFEVHRRAALPHRAQHHAHSHRVHIMRVGSGHVLYRIKVLSVAYESELVDDEFLTLARTRFRPD